MKTLVILAALFLAAPASAEFVECPNGDMWAGSDIRKCPCCEVCPDGSWHIEGHGACGEATRSVEQPVRARTDDGPPWDITRVSLRDVEWSTSADLSVMGYRLGDIQTGSEERAGMRMIVLADGLQLRMDSRDRVEMLVIEPEFASHLHPDLGDLLRDFSALRMQALFGIDDTRPENARDTEKREAFLKMVKDLGTDLGHEGKSWVYRRLGFRFNTRNDNQAALSIFPAARVAP